MRQSDEMVRRSVRAAGVAVLCVVGLSACRDSGLPDRNVPLQQARHRVYSYPAYQPTAQNVPVAHAGRHWIGSLPVETIPQRLLTPVATVEGTVLYALRDEEAPYSRLYSPVGENRWRPYLRLN